MNEQTSGFYFFILPKQMVGFVQLMVCKFWFGSTELRALQVNVSA